MFIYFEGEREQASMSRVGAEEEGEKESQADSGASAEPDAGLELTHSLTM